MKTINILIIIAFLISLPFLIQSASAISISSENYSVDLAGTGMATARISSTNYSLTALMETMGTTRNAEGGNYTLNIGFFENTVYYKAVSITSYSISPRTAVVGSTIGLSMSALNYQSMWARIISPNSQEQNLTLINGQTVSYTSTSVAGRYNVTFYANSSTGAIASAIDYFDLTAQAASSSPPPSSGGSGGTTVIIEKTCNYLWDCTPWSLCSNGKQTRKCEMMGECEIEVKKPKEEINCSEALFDIELNLDSLELTQNRHLVFSIDLQEKIGTEKLDVHIKYSIINSDNNEIFSQIVTKAVQGNLTYEKKIEEIGLAGGDYILRVDILYGNLQRAFTEQKFTIKSGELSVPSEQNHQLQQITLWFKQFDYKTAGLTAVILVVILVILLFLKRIVTLFKAIGRLFISRKPEGEHNRLSSIKGKNVYSESGDYIGKVVESVLVENRIEYLQIRIDRKRRVKQRGIAVNYRNVKNVGEIVIIDDKVLESIDSNPE